MTPSSYDRWTELADRDAVGEQLTADETEFLRSYRDSDPAALLETKVWDSFAALEGAGDELGDRALADAAVRAVLGGAKKQPTGRRAWLITAVGGTLAAAAAVALFILRQSPGVSVVEYVAASATAAGARVERGAHLDVGTEIEATSGPACVAVEPKIHACLAAGAKVRLSQVGVAERRVDLLAGRVAIALDPLPKGQRFSVVAGGVWSTAVGTAFTVELLPGGVVETIVHEGKVAVGAEHGAAVVPAHQVALSQGPATRITPLTAHERTETPDWVALGSVAHRSIEGAPLAVKVAPVPVPPVEAEALVEPAPPAPPSSRVGAVQHAPAPQKTAASSAGELLGVARQALRDQKWSDAAAAYRQIVSGFGSSPEAHTVLVPLANLELGRLGQPAAALEHLDAYLAIGGPLAMEARLARIHAFRALGRSSDEARAIDEFLAAHPSSLEAARLRERRSSLGAP